MGNRISCPSSMFTSSSPDHEQRVPKHLRPGKASKKQRQEARQQLQLQRPGHHHHQALGRPDPNDIGIAIAYPPEVPVFMFDPGKNDFVLNNKHMHGKTPPSSTLSEKHMQNQYSRHAPRQSTKKQLPTPPPTSDTAPRQRKFSVVTSMTSVNQLCKQQLPNDAGPMNAFEWFNGRRYPKQMGLMMPNDQQELDRIRVLNYILRWAFQGDIVAPVTSQLTQGTQVLNIGCGPGIWLGHLIIDLALDYPASQFKAVDVLDLLPDDDIAALLHRPSTNTRLPHTYVLDAPAPPPPSFRQFSPLHPNFNRATHNTYQAAEKDVSPMPTGASATDSSISTTPSVHVTSNSSMSSTSSMCTSRTLFDNLEMYAMDVRHFALPFANNQFQFVMERMSSIALSSAHWQHVIDEMIRVTAPGGYVQFIEIDYNSQNLGPAGQAWQAKICEAMIKAKQLDLHMASHIDQELRARGMISVTKKQISLPFGAWGLDIGMLWQQNLEAFSVASAPAIAMALGMSPDDCLGMWQRFRAELDHVKAFTNVYAVWAQKPAAATAGRS